MSAVSAHQRTYLHEGLGCPLILLGYISFMLVIRGVVFLIIIRPWLLVPFKLLPVAHYRKGGTTTWLKLS